MLDPSHNGAMRLASPANFRRVSSLKPTLYRSDHLGALESQTPGQSVLAPARADNQDLHLLLPYSHSMVPGGFEVMS